MGFFKCWTSKTVILNSVNVLSRLKLSSNFEYINLFDSKGTHIAEMIFKYLFLVLAYQALPLNSPPYELPEKEVGVTDRFSKAEMSVKVDQNDDNDINFSLVQSNDDNPLESAGLSNKVPMFIHLNVDQINEMHAEQNANFVFSQNVYVNLNSACHLKSITQLVTFFILTFM